MKSKGFTLIELIITIVILGVIGVFTFQFITRGLESYIMVRDAEDVAREARLALERMAREIRVAMNTTNSDPIVLASGSTITFDRIRPTNPDGTPLSTDNSTQVKFWLDGGTLRRQRDNNIPGEPLASNATGFVVTRNGDLITLDLTLSVPGQLPVQQRTLIYPRYFKYQ